MKRSMKMFLSVTFNLALTLTLSSSLFSQELTISQQSTADLSKPAMKGRYGGTFINDGKAEVYYVFNSRDGGVDFEQYSFDADLSFASATEAYKSQDEAVTAFPWYFPESSSRKQTDPSNKFIVATRKFGGGMTIKLGTISVSYWNGIHTGEYFNEEKDVKAKTGDIWRIIPSSFKSTSDHNSISLPNSFFKDLAPYGNPLLAPADATVIASGVIQEKVSIKNPPPTHHNQIAVIGFKGEDIEATNYNIYLNEYSAATMGSGLGQDGNLCVLYAPLNAPSTLKSHRHYLWKDRKNYYMFYRFTDNYELADSVGFNSQLQWGKFDVFNTDGSSVLIGLGNAKFEGWARNGYGMQFSKLTGIQVTQIRDGEVLFSKLYHEDEMKSKLVTPSGVKCKYAMDPISAKIKSIMKLPNGDLFAFGQSNINSFALQISPDGELQACYMVPRISDKSVQYNAQMRMKGSKIYLVLNEQPAEFSNAAQFNTSSSTFSGAYVTTTVTTTTVKKLNEVFVQSQILCIDTDSKSTGNLLVMNGKEFYPMGSFPALFAEDGIYFTGREKGPKGKRIHLAKVGY